MNKIYNLFWGMQFRTCRKFWESTDSSLVLSQNFLQIQKPHRHYFDCDYAKANRLQIKRESIIFHYCEAIRRIAEASVRSTDPHLQIQKINIMEQKW